MRWVSIVFVAVTLGWTVDAQAQTEWVLYDGNPVIPGVDPAEWPHYLRWPEEVLVVDGVYHMYFTGTASAFTVNHEIGHATSPDGITWTMDPLNPVFSPEAEGDWQVNSFGSAEVIHDGVQFRMWYGASDTTGRSQIGTATSVDGTRWIRYAGNPVFETGPEGEFDDTLVSPGTVLYRNGLYHMWYSGGDEPSAFSYLSIGHATSVDGLSWDRYPTPDLPHGSSGEWDHLWTFGPEVLFDGDSFHMWYTGGTWVAGFITPQVGYATSPDGRTWTKDPDNPIEVFGAASEQPQIVAYYSRDLCALYWGDPTPGPGQFSVNLATSVCPLPVGSGPRYVSGGRVSPDP